MKKTKNLFDFSLGLLLLSSISFCGFKLFMPNLNLIFVPLPVVGFIILIYLLFGRIKNISQQNKEIDIYSFEIRHYYNHLQRLIWTISILLIIFSFFYLLSEEKMGDFLALFSLGFTLHIYINDNVAKNIQNHNSKIQLEQILNGIDKAKEAKSDITIKELVNFLSSLISKK
ncbi:hypothetical protein HGO21_08290 [Acinetobacter sp. CUI P1]|uniref:hypothetical protein n=1 Tax=Paenibacillus sp. FSL E2-0201 TaxID=2954726 RepID=UPI001DAD83FC|nr:hypothetical protein [Acinetobacter sp. CUI P1]